jgi:hypothetical protein
MRKDRGGTRERESQLPKGLSHSAQKKVKRRDFKPQARLNHYIYSQTLETLVEECMSKAAAQRPTLSEVLQRIEVELEIWKKKVPGIENFTDDLQAEHQLVIDDSERAPFQLGNWQMQRPGAGDD